jgi:putative glutamine amidotransferase
VQSVHHQVVGRLGEGLRAVAWAADGVVEAIE